MKEMLYDINSLAIASSLFVSMAVAIECGFRIGRRPAIKANDASKAQVSAIQSSLLGILALLLGFTFSQSLQRFDARSNAVLDESNAIHNAFIRADLLPQESQLKAKQLLIAYTNNRTEAGNVSMVNEDKRESFVTEAKELQNQLWILATEIQTSTAGAIRTGSFTDAIGKLMQVFHVRDSALNRHVPEIVLMLLYGTFLMTGSIVGYVSGLSGTRTTYSAYVMVALIVSLVFVIVDLDRPRRGLIEIDQSPILNLQADMADYARTLVKP
ncbi:hypothetical protein KO525_14785 [Psychrosphaera sp. B3R10]|nr:MULTISPECIES: hypothetical protein [unclassified Psychrosphaera]MBU2883253.1 hypothetical protein [Psychrosphaera sp. I2R16]MBU2990653.1 hypothetical protein [Psychrosphaera sp. B3R10]